MTEALQAEKRKLKQAMRRWEQEFEEANGGLVPTHEDKKRDERYGQLKGQAKKLEHSLEASRKDLRKSVGDATPAGGTHAGGSGGGSGGGGGGSSGGSSGSGLSRRVHREAVPGADQSSGASGEKASQPAVGFAFEGGHISLSPFHVVSMLLACALPYAAFILGFSLMGIGAMVFHYLVWYEYLFYPLSLSALGLLVVLYVIDVSYWEHPAAVWARRLLLGVVGFMILVGGAIASAYDYSYAPLLMLFALYPAYW